MSPWTVAEAFGRRLAQMSSDQGHRELPLGDPRTAGRVRTQPPSSREMSMETEVRFQRWATGSPPSDHGIVDLSVKPQPLKRGRRGEGMALVRRGTILVLLLTVFSIIVGATNSAASAPGTANTKSGADLRIRQEPTTSSAVVGHLKDGQKVQIDCYARGETVSGTYGRSNIWDRIGPNRFVPDVYLYTGSDLPVVRECGSEINVTSANWTNDSSAVAPPFLAWSKPIPASFSIFGRKDTSSAGPLMVAYTWGLQNGAGACVEVLGFTKTGSQQWVSAGCGKGGGTDVYWGNVLAIPKVRVKSTSVISFAAIRWCAGASASKCFYV